MDWLSIAIIAAILIGLGAGLFFAARSPSFVAGLIAVAVKMALPVILKRKSPEEEAKDHDRLARGKSIGNEKPWGHEKGVDS